MKDKPKITEEDISRRSNSSSFQRGYEYYEGGAVESIKLRENQIFAEVAGSEYEPYNVSIKLDERGIEYAGCSCPYDYGGDCKHIVAVLLTYIHSPEEIAEQPPLEELISDLDEDQLYDLVLELVEHQPALYDLIEELILDMEDDDTKPASKDLAKQVVSDYEDLEEYDASDETLRKIHTIVDAGDGSRAIKILEGITDEYIDEVKKIFWSDEEGIEDTSFIEELVILWTEAILMTDLSKSKREELEAMLDSWREDLSDCDMEHHFDITLEAIKQDWDYPPLKRVLEGEITELGAWEREAPWYADDLAEIRLRVLQRQGRTQEYLYLSEAEGQLGHHVVMLVQLGRIKEAMDFSLKYLDSCGESALLAVALYVKNEVELAFQVAVKGLSLGGDHRDLAKWLRDAALEEKQLDIVIDAIKVLIREEPELDDYKMAQKLAGDSWQTLRDKLLEILRQGKGFPPGKVDIFLYEELIDDAIVALGQYFSYESAKKVLDVAVIKRPEWVIKTCQSCAESIINEVKSAQYSYSIKWLSKAKEAYIASDQKAKWDEYINSLLGGHKRKYKLVPMLKDLV